MRGLSRAAFLTSLESLSSGRAVPRPYQMRGSALTLFRRGRAGGARASDAAPAAVAQVPAGVRKSSTYFPEIESLRGIAILLVYLHHIDGIVAPAALGARESIPFLMWAFVTAGHTGVSLFFVLSAFLLSLPFLKEATGGRHLSRSEFYKRRALRILPLYYTAVIVGSIMTARGWADTLRGLPYFLFLNSVDGLTTSLAPFSNVWWSLATEIQFYLLLPFMPLFLRSRRGRRIGAGALLLFACAYAAFVGQWFHMSTFGRQMSLSFSVFGRGPAFLLGIAAAWIYLRFGVRVRQWLGEVRWIRAGGADLVLLATWLAMALLLRWLTLLGYWQAEGRPLHIWHVAEGFLWTAIVLQLLLSPLRTKRLFTNRGLARLGTLSYSIYILHVPMILFSINYLRRWYPAWFRGWDETTVVLVAAMSVGCLALSELTYRNIERPFLVRKAKLDR